LKPVGKKKNIEEVEMALAVPKYVFVALAMLAGFAILSLQRISYNRHANLLEVQLSNPSGPRSQMSLRAQDLAKSQLYAAEESAFPNCAIAWRSCNEKATDCMEVWESAGLLNAWKSACLNSEPENSK
jgi:hypothetical protein